MTLAQISQRLTDDFGINIIIQLILFLILLVVIYCRT